LTKSYVSRYNQNARFPWLGEITEVLMSLPPAKAGPGAEMLLKTHDVSHDLGDWEPGQMIDQPVQYKEVVRSGCCPGLVHQKGC
jgi:hypothetical protein